MLYGKLSICFICCEVCLCIPIVGMLTSQYSQVKNILANMNRIVIQGTTLLYYLLHLHTISNDQIISHYYD